MGLVFLGFAVLAFLAGVAGSFFIVRNLSGASAVAAFLVWLAAPFIILFAAFTMSVDPTLTQQQASYNVAMAFTITSFMIAIPWAVANLIGGLMGRRRKTGAVPGQATGALPTSQDALQSRPSDAGLPDWRSGDERPLSLEELGELMRGIAVRAGIEERLLPHLGPIGEREGTWLERDKFDYIYIGQERGVPMFDHRHVIADQTMYHVFSDVAFGLAVTRLAGFEVPPPDYDERVAAERQAILAGIDPRWGRQFALDRARSATT